MVVLTIYASRGVGALRGQQQQPSRDFDTLSGMKPTGVWVSCDEYDTNWHDWCTSENFRVEELTRKTRVVLKPDARVLRLSNEHDIDEFTQRYGYVPGGFSFSYIDWRAVARDYQGIIIAPYVWERRFSFHTFWYYSWDCASGCVWDTTCVESVRFVTDDYQVRVPATRWTREIRARVDEHGWWVAGEDGVEQTVVGFSTRHLSLFVPGRGTTRRRQSLGDYLRRTTTMRSLLHRFRHLTWEREGHFVHDSSAWTGRKL